jgi:hypothetical protein
MFYLSLLLFNILLFIGYGFIFFRDDFALRQLIALLIIDGGFLLFYFCLGLRLRLGWFN